MNDISICMALGPLIIWPEIHYKYYHKPPLGPIFKKIEIKKAYDLYQELKNEQSRWNWTRTRKPKK